MEVFTEIIKGLEKLLPLIIGIVLPIYTLRHTRKSKELEIADREKDRTFQIEKIISEESIQIMAKSYHLAHMINRAINSYAGASDEDKKKIVQKVSEAREYWEENLFYLPEDSRRLIIPFTNKALASFTDSNTGYFLHATTDHLIELFANIEKSFAKIMKKYNLFEA